MLAPADAALVARDPAIPGLALVLDPEAMAERLGQVRPDLAPLMAQATYVRYKPATSCLVAYRLGVAGAEQPVLVFAKAYRHGDGAKLAKARTKAEAGGVATFGPELVVVARVAEDRDLPASRRLEGSDACHADARRRLLRRLLPASPDLWEVHPRVLRYKPERRWVGVVERHGTPVALLKAYRRSRLPRAVTGLRFAAQASPASPRLLGSSTKAAALASSWVPGEALCDVLAGAPNSAVPLGDVGAAVATLHGADPSRLAPVRPHAEARAVAAAASLVATVLPASGPTAIMLADSLARRLSEGSPPVGPCHGDLSPDQVVCGPQGITLVDFDDAGLDDVTADLGHFAAALTAEELAGRLAPGEASVLFGDFLAGYAAGGGSPPPDLVAAHTAAALVRLAVEPFRLRQPQWPVRTQELLAAAQVWSVPHAVPC